MSEEPILNRSLSSWEEELAYFKVSDRENRVRRHCRISVVTPKNPITGRPMIGRRVQFLR